MNREEQLTAELKKHDYDDICCHNAFLHGVEWADKHPVDVWHDASEEPENGAHILMECKLLDSKEFKSYNIDYKGVVNWEVLKRYFGISRWAYISDLLPKLMIPK